MSGEEIFSKHAKELKGLFAALGILLVLVLCVYLVSEMRARTQHAATPATVPYPPPLTPQVQAQLAASKGFQVLVSYTDRGFEPAQTTLKRGGTVRFTNNSSEDLWVASFGNEQIHAYPGTSSCSASAFDSCNVLKPGDFWEFTFNTVGVWNFQNNLNKTASGTVTVKTP